MAFQGSLKELPLPDIIQLVSVSGKTGKFTLSRDADRGYIYLKNGQMQGSLLYVEHRATGDVVLKSNSMGSLSIVGNAAVITGKATLNGVGNYGFQATAVDNGEPGTTDQFGLKVTNPAGAVVADLTFAPLTLSGGNIQVPTSKK